MLTVKYSFIITRNKLTHGNASDYSVSRRPTSIGQTNDPTHHRAAPDRTQSAPDIKRGPMCAQGPRRSQSVSGQGYRRPPRRYFLSPRWPAPIRILHADSHKNHRKHSDTAEFFLLPELETSSECSFCKSSNAGQTEATLSHPWNIIIPCFPPITDITGAEVVAHMVECGVPPTGSIHTVLIGRFCGH